MAELAAAGLKFAGSARLAQNDLDLVVPPSLRPFFDELDDPNLVELLKDYVLDRQQRQDVFIKEGVADPPGAAAFMGSEVFVLASSPSSAVRQQLAKGDGGGGGDQGELLEALLEQLEGGATCLADLESAPEIRSFEPAQRLRALRRLLATDLFVICAHRPADARSIDASAAATRGVGVPLKLNRMILRDAVGTGGPATLTSPVAGGGCVTLNLVEAALLDALVDAGPAKVFQRAKRRLSTHKIAMQFQGRSVRVDQIDVPGLQNLLRHMQSHRLGHLVRLGIAES